VQNALQSLHSHKIRKGQRKQVSFKFTGFRG